MGFALWIGSEVAWAAGTYEYRALGAAVISNTQLFRERDFARTRRPPEPSDPSFAGYFASIGHLNQHLLARRRLSGAPRRRSKVGIAIPRVVVARRPRIARLPHPAVQLRS